MLNYYYADIDCIDEKELDGLLRELPQTIKSRIDNKTHLLSKKQSIIGYSLLKDGVKALFDREIDDIGFSENGKPLLDYCFFSISHSENMVICAISDLPVGIDIQKIKEIAYKKKYSMFSSEESDFINEISDFRHKRFFEIFTKKEALVKLYGMKLYDSISLDAQNVKFEVYEKSDYMLCVATLAK